MTLSKDTIDFNCTDSAIECSSCNTDNDCTFKIVASTNQTIIYCNAENESAPNIANISDYQCILTLECTSLSCNDSQLVCDDTLSLNDNDTIYRVDCNCYGNHCPLNQGLYFLLNEIWN